MAIRDLSTEMELAAQRRPFSNGFEGESWMSLWCEDGCRFNEECVLITVAMMGRTPTGWQETNPSSLDRYTCHEYLDSEVEEQS